MSTHGTVKAWPNFDARADAEALKKAMKGKDAESTVLHLLCRRNNSQRLEIRELFKTMHGLDLLKELKSELKGDLEDLMVDLCCAPAELDAKELHHAISGLGTKESVLIELLSSRSNCELMALRTAYQTLYGKAAEKDVEKDTSGHFKRLCVALIQGRREEDPSVDALKANQDARRLQQAGEKKMGTDESEFLAVLCPQSFPQLRQVFQEYEKVSGHSLEKAIEKEFSGDIRDGLLAVVKVVRDKPAYFAERLHDAMKGLGTKDRQLIRLIVSRSELDLAEVKAAYHSAQGKTLEEAIVADTKGPYKEALLTIVRGNV